MAQHSSPRLLKGNFSFDLQGLTGVVNFEEVEAFLCPGIWLMKGHHEPPIE